MAMCPLVFGHGGTLLRCLRPRLAGPTCPNDGATINFRLMLKFMKIHYFYYFSPYKYLFVLEVKETNFLQKSLMIKMILSTNHHVKAQILSIS